jgi:hypothetical protein
VSTGPLRTRSPSLRSSAASGAPARSHGPAPRAAYLGGHHDVPGPQRRVEPARDAGDQDRVRLELGRPRHPLADPLGTHPAAFQPRARHPAGERGELAAQGSHDQ